jgi:hypothetical protein
MNFRSFYCPEVKPVAMVNTEVAAVLHAGSRQEKQMDQRPIAIWFTYCRHSAKINAITVCPPTEHLAL